MVLQQVFLDSRYSTTTLPDGSHVWWLADAIYLPAGSRFKVRILNAWIPLTYYSIFELNDTLVVRYDGSTTQTIRFSHGNYDIDFIVSELNVRLQSGWRCSYSENTNKLTFVGPISSTIEITDGTTANRLLGVVVGEQSVLGSLQSSMGVDLTRTSSVLVGSNLYGANRDPVFRRQGHILAKVPISHQNFNEILEYTAPAAVAVSNQSIPYIAIGLFDDDLRPLDLNGVRFTMTLQIDSETVRQSNEPLPALTGPAAGKPADGAASGPQRRAAGDRSAEQPGS